MTRFVCDEERGYFDGFDGNVISVEDENNADYNFGYADGANERMMYLVKGMDVKVAYGNMAKNMETARKAVEHIVANIEDEKLKASVLWKCQNSFAYGVIHGIQIQAGAINGD